MSQPQSSDWRLAWFESNWWLCAIASPTKVADLLLKQDLLLHLLQEAIAMSKPPV